MPTNNRHVTCVLFTRTKTSSHTRHLLAAAGCLPVRCRAPKKETTSRMSEVNGRATPAHRRQRSRHTHAHATRRAPSAPPQRTRPHPRTRTHALAPTLRNLMLRAAAALHANTAHNPHPTTLTGQHRMLRARMTLTTATATATHTVRDPPRRDRHSQPPSIHATIHAHLIPTDALLGGCFGIYPAQSSTRKHSHARET